MPTLIIFCPSCKKNRYFYYHTFCQVGERITLTYKCPGCGKETDLAVTLDMREVPEEWR